MPTDTESVRLGEPEVVGGRSERRDWPNPDIPRPTAFGVERTTNVGSWSEAAVQHNRPLRRDVAGNPR